MSLRASFDHFPKEPAAAPGQRSSSGVSQPVAPALGERGVADGLATSPVILPFRRRSIRQPSDRNLQQAVELAVRLLVAGRVDDAEHRFRELATVARTWEMAERQAAWQMPSWVGVVVCHALRNEWLSAEMAAREHLSELVAEDIAETYLAAVALGNDWLINVPDHHRQFDDEDRSVPLRRFPRSLPAQETAQADPARDYAYALVSALRFRLGAGLA